MATDIDECIDEALGDITAVAYGGSGLLATAFTAWIAGLYQGPTAIFTDIDSARQRTVIDWWPLHILILPIEADPSAQQVGAVIDVVVRVLNAVKYAQIDSYITQVQEDAVVTLWQAVWD